MKSDLIYLEAVSTDSKLLTETSFHSKKMWGYSDELMNLWKQDLEISEEYILKNKVFKIYDEKVFIGFFAFKSHEAKVIELDHLWLKPGQIKKGYGRSVFEFILNYLRNTGHLNFNLTAEPNAKGFYDKMGGKVLGKFQSKVSGRILDIYQFTVNAK